jgi:hypothetical protein
MCVCNALPGTMEQTVEATISKSASATTKVSPLYDTTPNKSGGGRTRLGEGVAPSCSGLDGNEW